jgi:hypothetical protein
MQFVKNNIDKISLIKKAARCGLDDITQEIKTGKAEFFTLESCHFVIRTENTTRGKELVIVCAEGTKMKKPIQHIINAAISQKYDCLRYHPKTKRTGLALAKLAKLHVIWFDSEQYYVAYLRG